MMISGRSIYFVVVLLAVVAALGTAVAYYYLRYRWRRRFPYGNWESLLTRLSAVDRDKIALISQSLLNEAEPLTIDEDDSDLTATQIWSSIGGLEGLEVMERNCAVLVDLAFYVQQWYPEASIVAEELRLNARAVAWHVGRLKSAAQTGKLEIFFADYAQPAITTYYLMTRRVLALYEKYNLPGLGDLQRAI
ncbi:MAG: hypothetical protein WCD57_00525 [Acidobacteriaceae bacterium]